MMFTKKILGIHLNDISMEQEENSNLEERLKTIESHLASIAGTRRKQLTIRKRVWIIAGIVIASWIIMEVLAVFGLIG